MNAKDRARIYARIQESRELIAAADCVVRQTQMALSGMRERLDMDRLEAARFRQVLERWRMMGG